MVNDTETAPTQTYAVTGLNTKGPRVITGSTGRRHTIARGGTADGVELNDADAEAMRITGLYSLKVANPGPLDHDENGKKGGAKKPLPNDLESLTRAELDALAAEHGVDISEAKNKGDVIAALQLDAEQA